MMIKLDEAKLAAQQALWVVFSRGKIVVQESSESIPVAYLSDIPFLASYVDEIHQLPPLNETAHGDLPVYVVDLGAEHVDEPGWERVSLRQLLFAEYDIAFFRYWASLAIHPLLAYSSILRAMWSQD